MTDALAQAIEKMAPAAPAAPAAAGTGPGTALAETAAVVAPVKKYPKFRKEDWRDHPIAIMLNPSADFLARVEPGTASRCGLGEAWAYCLSCYVGMDKDVPPWAVALIATAQFAFAVLMAKAADWVAKRAGGAPALPAPASAAASASTPSPLAEFGGGT